MFPFFRKGQASKPVAKPAEAKPKPLAPEKPAAAPEDLPAPVVQESAEQSGTGIQVEELAQYLSPEVEQAVLFYANGRTGEAAESLRQAINGQASNAQQAWQLLFDLYETTGQRQSFEELALDYAVRLERSPPTWLASRAASKDAAATRYPSYIFGAGRSLQNGESLETFYDECRNSDAVLLDFSKALVADDAHLGNLCAVVQKVVAMGKEVLLAGDDAFAVRLNASRNAGKLGNQGWLLLLQLLQLQAKPQEFDEVALDYAVRFEMSPPSYTPPKQRNGQDKKAAAVSRPDNHAFAMHGVLNMGAAEVFEELRKFAEKRDPVEVDLSDVQRIDFAAVGLFVDTAETLGRQGKKVEFKGGNGMINLFLQMAGVAQFATIRSEPRK